MVDESDLTKGQIRKLNSLRKSVGIKIADQAFTKWLKTQKVQNPLEKKDVVAEKILKVLKPLQDDRTLNLGSKGYIIKRAKGRGDKGFSVKKVFN